MTTPEKSKSVTILGVDPGSIYCGFGLISSGSPEATYITSGRICPPASQPLHIRLDYVHRSLVDVIRAYRPDDLVVEKIFFAKSAKAALSLGHARGIVLLAAASEKVNLHELSALEVKKAVVGYGRAEKSQVEAMVRAILHIKEPLYPDSADALALALCHLNAIKFNNAVLAGRQAACGRRLKK